MAKKKAPPAKEREGLTAEGRLYIVIGKQKIYLADDIVRNYQLKPGDYTPFTNYKIFEEKP